MVIVFSPELCAAAEAGTRRPVLGPVRGSSAAVHRFGRRRRFVLCVGGKTDVEVAEEIRRRFAVTKGWR